MNGGKRKLSAWNLLVKKVYQEGRHKNKNYSFKQALTDASKRKSEMGSTKIHHRGKSRKHGKSRKNHTRKRSH
tara:strand:- start:1144 stop:1362 length:219 start_codon:yes stop_codon:yes gene_type:complete